MAKTPESQRRLKEPRPEDLADPVVQRFLAAEPKKKPQLAGPHPLARVGRKEVARRGIPPRRNSGGVDWREAQRIRQAEGERPDRVRRTWTLRRTRPSPCKACGEPMRAEQDVARLTPSGDTVHLACAPRTHLERS